MNNTGTGRTPEHKLTTSVSKVSSVFRFMEKHGVDRMGLLNKAGINVSVLSSPDNTLTSGQVHNLFREASSLSGDRHFGLHLGLDTSSFSNILAYILMNCSSLSEAFMKFIRYQKLVDRINHLEIQPGPTHTTVIYSSFSELCDTDRHLVDYRLSSLRHYPEVLTLQPVQPVEALFRYPCPEVLSEYQQIFKCKLSFEAKVNGLVYPNTIFDTPISDPNPNLLELFTGHADAILLKLKQEESLSQKVSRHILSTIRAEIPSIDDIAKIMAMGKRSLQMHLQKEGTSFSKLVSDVRREMAIHYLKDESYSISEIAYLLGYSEPSVFHRNFKKWTDATPGEYRANYVSEYEPA